MQNLFSLFSIERRDDVVNVSRTVEAFFVLFCYQNLQQKLQFLMKSCLTS